MGVIGTLTAGFDTVNRRLWLLLVPIALDLLLWCGPQVSIAPLVRRFAGLWITSEAVRPYSQQQIVALRQGFEEFARSFNLLSLISLTVPSRDTALRLFTYTFSNVLGVPTLVRDRGGALASPPVRVPAIELSDPWALAATTVVLLCAGVLVNAVFLGLLVQVVRDGKVRLSALLQRIGPNAGCIAVYLTLAGALIALVELPLLVFAGPLVLVNPVVGTLLVITPWLWLGFYLFFAPSAMLMSEVGPAQAARHSLNIARQSGWSALGLAVSASLIQAGVPLLWQQITIWPWGVLIGVVGNAYVSTGLTATVLTFYRDRYRALAAKSPQGDGREVPAGG